ncbi:hypothetical protein GCM10009817_12580 [Terrabacter lapilli]|uniref:Uncharacterized protein n=1 Tax=Terrabacter lapilli TaxID=436231 RepID=A0ABN2RRZ7_9MICO
MPAKRAGSAVGRHDGTWHVRVVEHVMDPRHGREHGAVGRPSGNRYPVRDIALDLGHAASHREQVAAVAGARFCRGQARVQQLALQPALGLDPGRADERGMHSENELGIDQVHVPAHGPTERRHPASVGQSAHQVLQVRIVRAQDQRT